MVQHEASARRRSLLYESRCLDHIHIRIKVAAYHRITELFVARIRVHVYSGVVMYATMSGSECNVIPFQYLVD